MSKKNKFTTGEFAKYFGISKDTLLYYDKIKLFSPAGVEPNGYRYYTNGQITSFRTLLSFREVGVSIKTLQNYFRHPSPDALEELSSKQLENIEAELNNLQNIKIHLTQRLAYLDEAKDVIFNRVVLQEVQDAKLIYFRQPDPSPETSEEQWSQTYSNFVFGFEFPNSANVGSVVNHNNLKNGDYTHVDLLFAYSSDDTGTVRKGGLYGVYYYKGSHSNLKKAYSDMLAQLTSLGYDIEGDAYEEYLVDEVATDNEEEYITKLMVKLNHINQ